MTGGVSQLLFGNVALIGCGLVGSSVCLDMRHHNLARRIVGYNVPNAAAEDARRLGVVDDVEPDLADAVKNADLVILATPVAAIADLMAQMSDHLRPDCIVMDVGSVKQVVVQASARLGIMQRQFVPCHPMAGGHHSGCVHARMGLFAEQCVWLTPVHSTSSKALQVIENLWRTLNANPKIESAKKHDEICAVNSHLPHLLAFAYMNCANQHADKESIFQSAGAGFRDFTRIAAGDPSVWSHIFKGNSRAILNELREFRLQLDQMEMAIHASGETSSLLEIIATSQQSRQSWEQMQSNLVGKA